MMEHLTPNSSRIYATYKRMKFKEWNWDDSQRESMKSRVHLKIRSSGCAIRLCLMSEALPSDSRFGDPEARPNMRQMSRAELKF
jgi:hypothetical protein